MKKLTKLSKAIEIIRENVQPDFQVQQLQMLLEVAQNDGITLPEIADKINTTGASVSRGMKSMSSYKNSEGKTVGHDLIYLTPDMVHRRRLAAHLTDNGLSLVEKLLEAL